MADSGPREYLVGRRTRILRNVLNMLFLAVARRRVLGLANVPAQGGFLFVFNHLSNFDPPLIFTVIPRADATGLVAANYREHAFYRFVIETGGGIWLRRGVSDRAALKTALVLLKGGRAVGIAPEGRRSPTGTLSQAKPGPAFLAIHAQAPIVPIGLTNTEKLGRVLFRLQRPTLTVRFGQAFRLPPPAGRDHKTHLQFCTDIIMCRIAALLPPEYRGIYGDHPLLSTFVAEAGQAGS